MRQPALGPVRSLRNEVPVPSLPLQIHNSQNDKNPRTSFQEKTGRRSRWWRSLGSCTNNRVRRRLRKMRNNESLFQDATDEECGRANHAFLQVYKREMYFSVEGDWIKKMVGTTIFWSDRQIIKLIEKIWHFRNKYPEQNFVYFRDVILLKKLSKNGFVKGCRWRGGRGRSASSFSSYTEDWKMKDKWEDKAYNNSVSRKIPVIIYGKNYWS